MDVRAGWCALFVLILAHDEIGCIFNDVEWICGVKVEFPYDVMLVVLVFLSRGVEVICMSEAWHAVAR
jgi:hypothetical protein